MEERGNKTIICSVFFLDIVEYSKKSVSGQISLKERFNAFLSTAIRDVPNNDRIILDTGDGAAISFLGDVEDALRAALSMRSSLLSEEGLIDPPLLVRMGVNLGPVRLVKDINDQPNIVGDGINVAQRVMGFAQPGQILVSRSYYDAASRLSHEYAGMFHFEGSRTDKHVREHEVYAIGYPGDVTASQLAHGHKPATKLTKAWVNFRVKAKNFWDATLVRYHQLATQIREAFAQASSQKKALYVGLAATPLLLLLLLVIKLAHKPEASLNDIPKVVAAVTSPASVVVVKPVEAAKIVIPVAPPAPVAAASMAVHAASAHDHKLPGQEKKEKQEKKISHHIKEAAPAGGALGIVSLTIKPWGEVYLDGKLVDVSPPLTKLQVPIGQHVIEVRNTTFPVYKQSIKVNAGEKISIAHKFAN
jgi:hypothetical protein